MNIKKLVFEGVSQKDLCDFPVGARRRAGYELLSVQKGEDPSDWKPMHGIGSGVKEIRIHVENEYRVIYVAKFESAIHVLHAFVKKTQQTAKKDIDIAKMRYQKVLKQYRS
jgi:phage-related protein